jgi:hypothetical protein
METEQEPLVKKKMTAHSRKAAPSQGCRPQVLVELYRAFSNVIIETN